jgi:hypothetical protein
MNLLSWGNVGGMPRCRSRSNISGARDDGKRILGSSMRWFPQLRKFFNAQRVEERWLAGVKPLELTVEVLVETRHGRLQVVAM